LADESPEWKAKFKGVIDACKACHKTFRAEKKK
jgi:predicted CxxxxCH...CXXCH cytochrome family protein